MRLATKVALTTTLITSSAIFLLGFSVLSITYSSSVDQAKNRLAQLVESIEKTNDDKISASLLAVQAQNIGLIFVQQDGTATVLQEIKGLNGDSDKIVQEISIENDEKLRFEMSTAEYVKTLWNSISITLATAGIFSAFATLTSWLVMRRDLAALKQLTSFAQRIVAGKSSDMQLNSASTELLILSNSLDSMVRQLTQAKEEMEAFLGDASHELRTPLTVIRGYLEILTKRDNLSEEQIDRAIGRAFSESIRMQQLINDILTLSELGQMPILETKEIDLKLIFEKQIQDLKTFQPERKVKFISNQSRPFFASEALITQLISNAFANIRQHTRAADTVMVTINQSVAGLEISVEDSGPGVEGLEPGEFKTSFRRFDQGRSKQQGGSGLGMSIMSRVAEAHGGNFYISKSELSGLRVSVFIPNPKVS